MAHTVTNEYKQVIYSGDSNNKLKLLFNNVELQNADLYCERVTIKSRIIPNGAKRFSLNNFISKEVEIILHDIDTSIIQDKVSISIGTLVGNSYEYVPIGIFNIQGTPTTDKNKITIKLRDNSVKFDFNYNAKPLIDEQGGSATKLQILQDICAKANVTCNISSFIGSTDSIGIYDNTITARQYIADIAEQAGRIATINRSGELIFVNINSLTTWDIPLSVVEKYEIGKAYRIGKVVYEDAIRKYETASTNYDTLYLDSSNPYISSQSQVNSILQQVNTFAIDSVKTGKILGNPAIDSYDLINVYDDKTQGNPSIFKTLATNDLVYNGVLINTFDTQIGEEERKENVTITGEATFKKWAATSINNINGEIDIQAGKIDNVEKEINPTKDVNGTTFYLEDSTDAELVNFELDGKTTQETSTQSANLLDEEYLKNAIYDTTIYKSTLTKVKGNRKLYVKAQLKEGKTAISGLYVRLSSLSNPTSPSAVYGIFVSDGAPFTNAYPDFSNNDTLYFTFYPTTTNVSDIFDTYNFWVSTDNINYEPFVPDMPSPDYPSELVSVGYKNELYNTATTQTVNGITYTKNDDGSITLNGTATSTSYIEISNLIPLHGTFTLSGGEELGSNIYMRGLDYNDNYAVRFNTQPNKSSTATVNSDRFLFYLYVSSNTTVNNVTVYPQLTKGTQAHSYIPYGKYGIEIKTQSKNYFDENNMYNGYYEPSNFALTSNNSYRTLIIKDLPKGTYTFSTTLTNCYVLRYAINNTNTYVNIQTNTYTFTLNQSGNFMLCLRKNPTSNITETFNTQIEKNTQATTYEEYKGKTYLYTLNQPLRSIGDTKDLLYIKNGMLYVERKIGSATFKGTENWNLYTSNTVRTIFYTPISQQMESYTLTTDIPKLMSSHFIPASQNATWKNGDISRRTNENNIYLIVANGYTIDTFKTWLSTNNTEVQYILASSNTEGLGKIEVPSTYKTITYIDTIDINEPNMNITYVRDTQISNYVEEHISQIIVNEKGIVAEVNKKVDDEEIIAKLNLAIEDEQGIIEMKGNQVTIDSDYFELNADGTIKSTGGTIGGYKIGANQLYAETFSSYNFTQIDLDKMIAYLMGTTTLTDAEKEKYDLNGDGSITSADVLIMKFYLMYRVTTSSSAKIIMQTGNNVIDNAYILKDGAGNEILNIGFNGIRYKDYNITDKRYVGESIRVKMSAAQTISRNTATKVNVDTVDYNTSTMLTYSSNSVVIGKNVSSVLVNCRYTAFGANSSERYIYIYKNGSVFAFNNRSYSQTMETTVVVPVQENDYIEMYCYSEQSENITISSTANQTFLQVAILG